MVHGLAGSGALTALVLAELPTTASRLGYIVLFGAGSVAGMSLLSGAVGVPLALVGRRDSARAALAAVSGCISVALGIFWALRF
jgi:high-affinity nickel-transport protein